MKKLFAEYYALPEDRINEIWANSLIVFDTNVLLNLYRYNEDARKEFIKVIEFYKERLWIPYQVGLEFHRCREDILRKNAAAYQELGEEISKGLLKVIDTLNSQRDCARHPYINMKDIRSKVERCATSIAKSLKKQEENHPDHFERDEILDAITQLFDGRVGLDFSEEELATIYQEGEHRFANKVPPGYCDEKHKKDKPKRHLYGDLIVWKQTISHSAEQKKDIIFITDDHKTDWWDKVEGKYTPRKELIKEFAESTGQCVLIYDSSRFLEYAKQNKGVKVSRKTMDEASRAIRDSLVDMTPWLNILEVWPTHSSFLPTFSIPTKQDFFHRTDSLFNTYGLRRNGFEEFMEELSQKEDVSNMPLSDALDLWKKKLNESYFLGQ